MAEAELAAKLQRRREKCITSFTSASCDDADEEAPDEAQVRRAELETLTAKTDVKGAAGGVREKEQMRADLVQAQAEVQAKDRELQVVRKSLKEKDEEIVALETSLEESREECEKLRATASDATKRAEALAAELAQVRAAAEGLAADTVDATSATPVTMAAVPEDLVLDAAEGNGYVSEAAPVIIDSSLDRLEDIFSQLQAQASQLEAQQAANRQAFAQAALET